MKGKLAVGTGSSSKPGADLIWNYFEPGSRTRAGNRDIAGGGIENGNGPGPSSGGGTGSDSGHSIRAIVRLVQELPAVPQVLMQNWWCSWV